MQSVQHRNHIHINSKTDLEGYMCVCLCVCICIYIHIYICTYTHNNNQVKEAVNLILGVYEKGLKKGSWA